MIIKSFKSLILGICFFIPIAIGLFFVKSAWQTTNPSGSDSTLFIGTTGTLTKAKWNALVDKTMFNYSTTEQDTGIKWIDGKTVYRKVFTKNGFLNNGTIAHGITNLDKVISINGAAKGTYRIKLPYRNTSTDTISILLSATDILIYTSGDFSAYNGYIIVEYTKS